MKFIAQQKLEPVATFYMRVYQFVKWLTPQARETTYMEIHRALFVHNLKYPLNKVVIREDDLEKVLINMLKLERQVVQGYLVLCVGDSEEEDDYDPLAVHRIIP